MKYISWHKIISHKTCLILTHTEGSWWLGSVSGSGWACPSTMCLSGHLQKYMKSSVSLYIISKLFTDIFNAILLFYPCLNLIRSQLSRFCNLCAACFFSVWLSYFRHIANKSCKNSGYIEPSFLLRFLLLYPRLCHSLKSSFYYIRHWCFLQEVLNNDEWLTKIWKNKTILHVP